MAMEDHNITKKDLARYLAARAMPKVTTDYGRSMGYQQAVNANRIIRDSLIHRYAPLFGAISTFLQVAVSREYYVMGRKTPALRTQKLLMEGSFYDGQGIKNIGFQKFMHSVLLDWLTIGRGMWTAKREDNSYFTSLRYLDAGRTYPINGQWHYQNPVNGGTEIFDQSEVWFMDSFRMGTSGVPVSPVAKLIPISHLMWLMHEHDMRQLDGRIISDVFLVRGKNVGTELKRAVADAVKLNAGAPPEDNNVAIVSIDMAGAANSSVEDMVYRLGLSQVPQGTFTREELEGMLARSVSAVLGLPIGQWWYDPRGTNRSLEQVQQERALLKGPAFAVRTLSREFNQSEIMRGRNTPGRWAMMSFKEETDSSTQLINAESLSMYATSIAQIQQIMVTAQDLEKKGINVGVQADQWLQYFERTGLIPHNALAMTDLITLEEMDDNRRFVMKPDDRIVTVDQFGRIGKYV